MHRTAEGQEVSRQGAERPTGSGWEGATGRGHSKLSLVGHTAEMLCPQETASGIWEMSGTLPGLSRPSCETSCSVTAIKKRDPTTVLKSTAYMIPVHGA